MKKQIMTIAGIPAILYGSRSRNVYLYSPQNSDCWYLLDWDNDGMLRRKEREIMTV